MHFLALIADKSSAESLGRFDMKSSVDRIVGIALMSQTESVQPFN